MKRTELEHILRAASRISGDRDVVVIGSQSILGTYSEDELPEAAHASIEADIAFWDDPGNDKSDTVDMHMGEDSQFHATFGYYAQGVDVATAVLTAGWRDRVVVYQAPGAAPAVGHCLEPHDLVVAKLVAGREKDFEFVSALLAYRLVDASTLIERATQLQVPLVRTRVLSWVASWVSRHG